MILRVLLLFFSLFLSASSLLRTSQANDGTALYCFVNVPQRTSFDPNILSNISCTHFVYGSVPIDNPRGTPEFSNYDVRYMGRDGNMRKFLRLRSKHRNAKFLLGVQREKMFRDVNDASEVAEGVEKAYKERKFDGVFIKFNGHHLSQYASIVFVKALTTKPTIRVNADQIWEPQAMDRLRQISEHVEHVYLDMTTIPSNEDPLIVTQVDVLLANGTIPYEDTIQGNVDKLSEEGIMPHKVVVGLSSSGWTFKVPSVLHVTHGDYADEPGRRIPYQQACKARGAVLFDNQTMNELTIHRQDWTCANLPSTNALGKKIEWILHQNFAGVGLSSIFEDDPKGECGSDPLPSHALAMQIVTGTLVSGSAKCTRLCYISPEEIGESFPFDSIKSEFCSHIVVNYLDIGIQKTTEKREGVDELLSKINVWRKKVGENNAPRLILSIGSDQPTSVWSLVMANALSRKQVIDKIIEAVNNESADGVEVSWTKESMSNEFDNKNLMSLIDEINGSQEKLEVIMAASAESTFANLYDVTQLNKTVDLVVLQTHKLHSNKIGFTGHPSPLRAVPSMKNQKMSVEEVVNYWTTKGMARRRLAISLTASAISMSYIAPNQKSVTDAPFGQVVSLIRSNSDDITTQQEICESLQMETSTSNWVDIADVPYILRKNQLVAYENVKSAQVKAVWASVEGIGLAMHNLPADDPFGICDNRTAFPILTQLTRTQVCPKCIKQHNFRKCEHDFKVSCSFDLESSVEYKPIFKTSILPYERCTEIVVEQLLLRNDGKIGFTEKRHEIVAKNLTEIRSKMGKCGLVASLSCGKFERSFTRLLVNNMTMTIDNILSTMKKYKFSGVLLDCEEVVNRQNHRQFNMFVKNLQERMGSEKAPNNCSTTLSIRFSGKTLSPNSLYQVSQLNKLSHISLTNIDQTYKTDKQFMGSDASTEALLSKWLTSGVKPSKIVLEISPFAIRQSKNGTLTSLRQGEVCEAVGNRAKFEEDFLNFVSTNGHSTGLISSPTIATFKYKIGFAVREGLAGVSVRSVNGDDYTGICGRGSFPILKSIYRKDQC